MHAPVVEAAGTETGVEGAPPLGGRVYRLTKLVEKPTAKFARENLVTPGLGPGEDGEGRHLVVFGQYVLPAKRTFDILAEDIRLDRRERCASRHGTAPHGAECFCYFRSRTLGKE